MRRRIRQCATHNKNAGHCTSQYQTVASTNSIPDRHVQRRSHWCYNTAWTEANGESDRKKHMQTTQCLKHYTSSGIQASHSQKASGQKIKGS